MISPDRSDPDRKMPHVLGFQPWRDLSMYVVSAAALVGVFFVLWSMINALDAQRQYQSNLMETEGVSVSAEISRFVRERTRQLSLFGEQNAALLYRFMQEGERSPAYLKLKRYLRKQYPNHFAFTVRDSEGSLFPDDMGQFVGPACQRDIESFWDQHRSTDFLNSDITAEAYKPFIHPMPDKFHFDMMTHWRMPSGQDGILFVSFYLDEIVNLISRFQLPGHRVLLVRNDTPDLIEVEAQGARDQLGEHFRLSDEELASVVHKIPIEDTRWTTYVMPQPGFFEDQRTDIHTRALYQILGIAVFWGVALWLIWRDLKRRRENDIIIEEQTERLLGSQAIAHVGSWDWDIQTGTFSWTDEIYRIFGRSRDDFGATYENFLECIHKDDREAVHTAVRNAVDNNVPYNITHRVVRPDGSIGFVLERAKVYRDRDGTPLRMLGVVHDITERTHLDRSKAAFIAVISHELRTPLTAVKGTLGLLSGGALGQLPEKAHDMLDVASRNADRLIEMVNDILDLEKLESGKMEFHFEDTDLAGIVTESVKANLGLAAKHNIKLNLTDHSAKALVRCDRGRIIQVMTNLLSNAAKFSDPGAEVRISIEASDEHVTVSIQDFGPGIPDHMRVDIFDRFTQVDASDVRSKSGTGLGLSICKSIIDAHGGDIRVDSHAGEGSVFSFTLSTLS